MNAVIGAGIGYVVLGFLASRSPIGIFIGYFVLGFLASTFPIGVLDSSGRKGCLWNFIGLQVGGVCYYPPLYLWGRFVRGFGPTDVWDFSVLDLIVCGVIGVVLVSCACWLLSKLRPAFPYNP